MYADAGVSLQSEEEPSKIQVHSNEENMEDNLNEEFQSSVELRRSEHKVMIIMAGESGAGKSSTMKFLLTGLENSEMDDLAEYGKDISVDSETQPIKGILSFVDIPSNVELLSKFRNKHTDFIAQTDCPENPSAFTKLFYPNLVIFTVSACDNRMVGPESNLRMNLKTLKESSLVDEDSNNLIVCVTHSMSLPAKIYAERAEEIKANIRRAVWDIFNISDVKVVFVENLPEDFDMEKPEGFDFYELPDGQMSHHNLIEAMLDQFETNGDLFGKRICGYYFRELRSTEKDQKASILLTISHNKEEVKKKTDVISEDATITKGHSTAIPEFCFQYIGRGYCPRTENFKNVTIFMDDEKKNVDMFGKQHVVSSSLNIIFSETDESYLLTAETKEKYQQQRLDSYGLSNDHIDLSVNVSQSGKWVKDGLSNRNNTEVIFVHERRLAEVTLTQPEKFKKSELTNQMDRLPDTYDQSNCHLFNEFFSKWGTHFVFQEWLGGSVEVESSVNVAKYDENQGANIKRELDSYFERMEQGASGSFSIPLENEDTVTTYGGDPATHLSTLQDVTPLRVSEWVESLSSNLAELKHSFKLCPYYVLADGEQQESLRSATQDYISGNILTKLKKRKRGFESERVESDVRKENEHLLQRRRHCCRCFPLSSIVYTRSGVEEIGNLKPGIEVLSANWGIFCQNTHARFTEFLTYLHYEYIVEAKFCVFTLDNGQVLTVSGNHLIFSIRDGNISAVIAEKLKVGDEVPFVDEDKKIQPVKITSVSSTISHGLCSPLTWDGVLIVDGVIVSCYANIESFCLAHFSTLPLRLWHKLPKCPLKFRSAKVATNPAPGIHVYPWILLAIRKFLTCKWF